MTALAPLVSHHDVTWIASALSDEDRVVAAEGRSRRPPRRLALPAEARRARSGGLRPLLPRRRQSGPLVRSARSVGAQARARSRPPPGLGGRLRRGQPGVRRRSRRGARPRSGHGGLLPRLPPLPRARARARAAARRSARALHHIPWVEAEGWSVLPDADRPGDPRGAARQRRRRLPHRALARGVPRHVRRASGLDAGARSSRRIRSRSIRPSSTALAASPRCSSASASCSRDARAADRARRPHRSVEERRRAGSRRSRACSSAAPSCTGRVVMLALLDPSRQEIPEYIDDGGGSRRRRAAVKERFPGRASAADRRRLPAVGRRVQAVRRAARERRHGRSQPRRQGGAAREHARWRCCLSKTQARTRSSASGTVVDPLDVEGQADALAAALELPAERARARLEAIRSTFADTTSRAWIEAQLADLDRASTMRGDERSLARRRDRRGAHGRRGRQAACRVAGPSRAPWCGWRRRRRQRSASCRRATRSHRAARRDHGRQADERADPALPSAAALARRGRARRSAPDGVEIRRRRETTAQTGVEMEALDGGVGRGAHRLRHGEGDRQGDDDHGRGARREDEGAGVRAAVLTVSDGVAPARGRIAAATLLEELLARRRLRGRRGASCPTSRRDRGRDRRARRGREARPDHGRHRLRAARRHAGGDRAG